MTRRTDAVQQKKSNKRKRVSEVVRELQDEGSAGPQSDSAERQDLGAPSEPRIGKCASFLYVMHCIVIYISCSGLLKCICRRSFALEQLRELASAWTTTHQLFPFQSVSHQLQPSYLPENQIYWMTSADALDICCCRKPRSQKRRRSSGRRGSCATVSKRLPVLGFDVLQIIFKHCTGPSRLRFASVCRLWHAVWRCDSVCHVPDPKHLLSVLQVLF
jgi:hypothetical protein